MTKIQHFFTATLQGFCSNLCNNHCICAYSKASIFYIQGFLSRVCNGLWALMDWSQCLSLPWVWNARSCNLDRTGERDCCFILLVWPPGTCPKPGAFTTFSWKCLGFVVCLKSRSVLCGLRLERLVMAFHRSCIHNTVKAVGMQRQKREMLRERWKADDTGLLCTQALLWTDGPLCSSDENTEFVPK